MAILMSAIGRTKHSRLTLGTRLLAVFAAMSALILTLVFIYVASYKQSSRVLDAVLHLYNKKLDIGAQVELATTEMQGAQRGLMLSYAMHDPGAAVQYIRLYADSQAKIDGLLSELPSLQLTDTERISMKEIRKNRDEWAPRFEKLVETCHANKVLSAAMHASATSLVEEQRKTLEAAHTAQAASVAESNWIALFVIAFSMLLGITVVQVVRGISHQLRLSIVNLHEGANQVAQTSGQISSSSQSLAQGASDQAASLEETSTSSQEVAAMVHRNAASAQNAANFMSSMNECVVDANNTLADMIVSMQEIGKSSGRISKIIRVIDEIAFQTNILALNAAVEAARAGEAGMGFAVVADEVRNLAQRSAQAARDTAELIEESMERSNAGSTKLSEVAASIHAITEGTIKVKGLVDEVEAASREQAQGIEQISKAVSRIGDVTLRTAASAEESAAASEELNAQSHALVAVVGELQRMVGVRLRASRRIARSWARQNTVSP